MCLLTNNRFASGTYNEIKTWANQFLELNQECDFEKLKQIEDDKNKKKDACCIIM